MADVSGKIVICDMIRHEANGKIMLIGVYPEDVVITPNIPGSVTVAAWVQVRGLDKGAYRFTAYFRDPASGLVSQPWYGNMDVNYPTSPTSLPIGPLTIEVKQPAFIDVLLDLYGPTSQTGAVMGRFFAAKAVSS